MDIVFVYCVALGGHRYDLHLVDAAKIYSWIYGMLSLSSISTNSSLEQFKSDAGRLPQWFHSDFNGKLMSGNSLHWILSNGSDIIEASAGRQSSNVLAEHAWCTLIQMARAYITENQVGQEI